MISTKVIVIPLFLIITAAAYKYDILFRDETVFSPCNYPNVKHLNEYIDYSNTTYEFLNNGSLYIHGSFQLIKDIGSDDNAMSIQVFKKVQGRWVNTIYHIYRPDWCKAVFSPYDIWYKYMKDVSPEERKCPFYKGKIFPINEATDFTVDVADPRLGGDIKIENLINLKGINQTICLNIFAEICRQ